jgi:hypothetical protein
MGVVDTTYTFNSTDTITSSKLNNIIDDTTFTNDAISGSSLQVVSPGKLAVAAGGITANELASGAVTQAKLGTNVAGNGPLVIASSLVATSVPTGATPTKITLGIEQNDTNNNFTNSRFTPTVAGFYQINGSVNVGLGATALGAFIYKNGSSAQGGNVANSTTYLSNVSSIVYCNGSSDYIELYASHTQGTTVSVLGIFYGCLIRSA